MFRKVLNISLPNFRKYKKLYKTSNIIETSEFTENYRGRRKLQILNEFKNVQKCLEILRKLLLKITENIENIYI